MVANMWQPQPECIALSTHYRTELSLRHPSQLSNSSTNKQPPCIYPTATPATPIFSPGPHPRRLDKLVVVAAATPQPPAGAVKGQARHHDQLQRLVNLRIRGKATQ